MDSNYNEISIYEYYKTINTNRSILLKINATVLIVTLILLLVLPNVYRSEAIIIPPLDNNSLGLMNILNEIPFDIGVSDNESEIYTYVAIIKSRTLIGKIVKDYNLIEYYGVDNIEDAIKELRGNINIELTDEGTLALSVDHPSKWFGLFVNTYDTQIQVQEITNAIIFELDQIYRNLKNQQARTNRIFVENRYNQNIKDLYNAEEKLKTFQEENNIIAFQPQLEESFKIYGALFQEKTDLDIQFDYLKDNLDLNNSQLQMIKSKNEAIETKIKDLLSKSFRNTEENRNNYILSFRDSPELGVKYLRLTREVEIQNKIFQFLTQQYEEAKVMEAKDSPIIQILDSPNFPYKKHTPKRFTLLVLAMILSTILSIIYVFIRDSFLKKIHK